MSPEAFCKATYGGGTAFTSRYGYPEGETIPFLFDRCVETQSQKSKRFEISNKNWSKLNSDILK
jgi:hypothetical protein